jgi:hypothetical protein
MISLGAPRPVCSTAMIFPSWRRQACALVAAAAVLLPAGVAQAAPAVTVAAGGTHAAIAPPATTDRVPKLGAKVFAGKDGVGWGTYKPSEIFNGGDPSGLVRSITWTGWGHKTSVGMGKTFIFKPSGGYYPGSVRAELRASNLGHCVVGGPLTYRHLAVREPSRPGGPLGPWTAWSGAKSLCKFGF